MSRPNVLVSLVTDDETDAYRLDGFEDVVVEHGQYGSATCEVSVRPDSRLGDIAIAGAVGEELFGYQLWVAENGANVFRGPVFDVKYKAAGPVQRFTIQAENHLQHALRRRCNWTSTLAKSTEAATAPNQIAINLIDDAIGGVAGPVTPAGYPAATSRADWGHSVAYSAGAAVGAPAAVTNSEQGGTNLQDVIEDLCQRYDMCPVLLRNSAADYDINIEYPYEDDDMSGTVCLTANRGNLSDFGWTIPYTLTTVGRAAGSGAGAAQTDDWDAANVATYGVWEDQITEPTADATACTETASALIRASSPLIVVEGTARPTTSYRFNDDYVWRDTVLIHDPVFGRYSEQMIVAWKLVAWNGGRGHRYTLIVNEQPTDMLRLMAGKTGLPFGRSAGGRYRQKDS